jgi:prolyl 4-hydroxylase
LCAWLIERARPLRKPALVDNLLRGGAVYSKNRTNSVAEFGLTETDVVMHMLRARMGTLAGPTVTGLEATNILHYEPGQHNLSHYDFYDPSMPDSVSQVSRFGQRVLTILIYLNDSYERGETEFPRLGWRFKGKTGDVLFFWNVDRTGAPDLLSIHAGTAPVRGDKWALSQWVRGRAA